MSAQPIRICHIIHRLAVGGLENGLVNIINHLPAEKYRHTVICLTNATDFRHRITAPNVEIVEIHKRPGKDFAAYGRVWRTLRRLHPRIVHTRNLPALDMLLPAWLAGAPRLVHSEHGLDVLELDGKSAKYNRLRRLSRPLVDRYITMSRDLNAWLCSIGIPAARIETIYNGVDTDRFTPDAPEEHVLPEGFAPPGSIVIGTIGRFEVVKNQLGLAQAFVRLLTQRPELRQKLRLVLIGDGSQREAIEAALDETQARPLSWMPGFRDDTPALYRALDLFVLPSLREGISNTILEAMASGRAVVATRVGGNPEILPDGIAGTLVAPDDPDALAAALLRYVENPTLISDQGIAGRAATLNGFSLTRMVENYDRVYRALCNGPGPRIRAS